MRTSPAVHLKGALWGKGLRAAATSRLLARAGFSAMAFAAMMSSYV